MSGVDRVRTKTVLSVGIVGLAIGVAAAVLVTNSSEGPAQAAAGPATDAARPGGGAAGQVEVVGVKKARVAAADAAEAVAEVEEATAANQAEAARQAAIQGAVDALGRAHAELHTDDAGAEGLDAAVEAIVAKVDGKSRRRALTDLLAKIGPGRFVAAGRLTPLGAAVRARLAQLSLHAIDPAPYDVDAIEARLATLPAAANAAESEATPASRAVSGILAAPTFDAAAAAARLAELSEIPGPTQLSTMVTTAAAQRGLAKPTAADLPADTAMADALLQLVLDFRFVRKTGPFKLRRAETVLEKADERRELVAATVKAAEAADDAALAEALDPPHPLYRPMLAIHERYLELAGNDCPTLPEGWRIRPGMKGDEVKKLQRRLACEGYYTGEIDGVFEGDSVEAARTYQSHHELDPDADVAKGTIRSMNVPLSRRVEQIRMALMRMRESDVHEMAPFHIRVNLPAFELQVFDDGKIIRRHRVIVGTNRLDDDKEALVQGHLNRTPLLTTRLYEVVINPRWILPQRIVKGEIQGKLAEDPDYLAKKNIRVVELDDGRELLVQGKGDDNALGKVKFLLEKTNHIYLHDTDKRHLFSKNRRDFSHGCMRVQDAIEFGKWLLTHDGWEEADVERAFASSAERGVDLKKPIDLYTDYITVDIADDGLPMFLTDVYDYDEDFEKGQLPPRTKVRWGSAAMRPRWVPLVSKATVDEWRAKGQAAPRDYDPEKHGK